MLAEKGKITGLCAEMVTMIASELGQNVVLHEHIGDVLQSFGGALSQLGWVWMEPMVVASMVGHTVGGNLEVSGSDSRTWSLWV